MASPVTVDVSNPAAVIGPAIAGTIAIFNSVAKFGPNVCRVVVTSSAASIMEPKDGPYTFTEADWNTFSPGEVERIGGESGIHVYRTAKVTAERAAWKFMEDNKGKLGFDLATILPPLVYGPLEQEPPARVESLNMTMFQLYKNFIDPPPPVPGFSLNIIDVRDVAMLHVLCLEKEEAGGERWIPSSGPFTWAELRDMAIQASVQGIAPGTPEGYVPEPPQIIIDGSKAAKVLGLKYHSKMETAVDAIQSIYLAIPSAVPAQI
ncbi:NAD(P)-binding protein, partial [Clavulina sp. PMI_390]